MSTDWPRNRLLRALPSSHLKRLMPELERISCPREQASVLCSLACSFADEMIRHDLMRLAERCEELAAEAERASENSRRTRSAIGGTRRGRSDTAEAKSQSTVVLATAF